MALVETGVIDGHEAYLKAADKKAVCPMAKRPRGLS